MQVAFANDTRDKMQRYSTQDRNKKPPLRIEIARDSGIVNKDFVNPSVNASFGHDNDKPNFSPRVMRSACDFCHTKRIKCKRDETDSPNAPCEQCKRRGNECKFSYKEKTGPKPKVLHAPKDGTRFARHASSSPSHQRSNNSRTSNRSSSAAPHGTRSRSQFSDLTNQESPRTRHDRQNPKQEPVTSMSQIDLERRFLRTYLGTVAQAFPFCEDRVLLEAMAEREEAPNPNSVNSSVAQAQLAAALAIGALIHCDSKAELYHCAAREHLKQLFSSPSPEAANALSMLAFYWQYRGDDDRKTIYVKHAKLGLENPSVMPSLELHMCMEYLDYDNAENPRNDAHSLPPILRVLHVVSCMLGNIQILMDPAIGMSSGLLYCRHLKECSAALSPGRGEDVPALLCLSLYAFLLIMLGQKTEAVRALLRIPGFLKSCPDAPRALPLSWDTCLIAGLLSFLLQLLPTYELIHRAVENSQNATAATQWTCRLPVPGASAEVFLNHNCRSTSNICSIIVQLWKQTNQGNACFYSNSPETLITQSRPILQPSPSQVVTQRESISQNDTTTSSSHSSFTKPPRPHRELSGGVSEYDDLSPDTRSTHLLNSNQASPIPYTPKRLRNSRCNSPSGSESPAARQPWNEAENANTRVKEENKNFSPESNYQPLQRKFSQGNNSKIVTEVPHSLTSSSSWPSNDYSLQFGSSLSGTQDSAILIDSNTLANTNEYNSYETNSFPSSDGIASYSTRDGRPITQGHTDKISDSILELFNNGNTSLLGDINSNGAFAGLGFSDDDPILPLRNGNIGIDGLHSLSQLNDTELYGLLNDFGSGAENLPGSFQELSS